MTRYEAEYKLLYSTVVAGKSAKFADNVMSKFLKEVEFHNKFPFDTIRYLKDKNYLEDLMRRIKTGCYSRLVPCWEQCCELDAETCTLEELEAVRGIGPKTSRFFLLLTRPGIRHAALDTHILKWLRTKGHKAPKATPQNKARYRELEKIFLSYADKLGKTPRELDEEIWASYANK